MYHFWLCSDQNLEEGTLFPKGMSQPTLDWHCQKPIPWITFELQPLLRLAVCHLSGKDTKARWDTWKRFCLCNSPTAPATCWN